VSFLLVFLSLIVVLPQLLSDVIATGVLVYYLMIVPRKDRNVAAVQSSQVDFYSFPSSLATA
jgi:hypothetical protein